MTLVCQEASQPGNTPKSPTKLVSYYTSGMFPPAPAPPMARPVTKLVGEPSSPPVSMQISPVQQAGEAAVRLSPASPAEEVGHHPRILYTYSGGPTIALPDNLSPTNLSIVQPPRSQQVQSPAQQSGHSVSLQQASSAPQLSKSGGIRWTTSAGFISDIESSSIAGYDLMTPMISGAAPDNNNTGAAALQLTDGLFPFLMCNVFSFTFFRPVFLDAAGADGRDDGGGGDALAAARAGPDLPARLLVTAAQ